MIAAALYLALTAMPEANQQLVETLARLLYGENRQNLDQPEAKGIVDSVMNRTELAGYPDDPIAVIHQPGQYTPFDPSNPNYPVIQKFGLSSPDWARYIGLVQQALASPRLPYTHYHSHPKDPSWARGIPGERAKLGAHTFLTEPRRRKKGGRPSPP